MRTGSKPLRLPVAAIPGPVYCDASALVKLYLPEPESEETNRIVAGRKDLLAADLGVTEIVSSLARRWREGAMSLEHARRFERCILADMDRGFFRRVELTPATYRRAEHLLLSLSGVSLRAADALHLALALEPGAVSILTFDRRLAQAARGIGLHTVPVLGQL